MKTCAYCQGRISESATVCRYCSQPQPITPTNNLRALWKRYGRLLLIFGPIYMALSFTAGALIGLSVDGKPQPTLSPAPLTNQALLPLLLEESTAQEADRQPTLPPAAIQPPMSLPTTTPADAAVNESAAAAVLQPDQSDQSAKPVPTLTAVLAPCISPYAEVTSALVTAIIDGNTIDVSIDGVTDRVRYIGISTPEGTRTVDSFGPAATARNRELVLGQLVTLVRDSSERDRYDRLLRYVFVGSRFVNYEMVRTGMATAADVPPDSACAELFRQAEYEAQNHRMGIWSSVQLTPAAANIVPDTGGPAGQNAECDCQGPVLNCQASFITRAAAQSCFDRCRLQGYGDMFTLDDDLDGLACESLP